jgi:AmiR/NasT family two-component response regulator
MNKVIVLTGRSLLTQGIASSLRGSTQSMEVETIDATRADLIEVLETLQPEIIIMETSQERGDYTCSLQRLFEILPNLIVMEVNLSNSSVLLIRSNLYNAPGFASLLSVIENVRTNLSDVFSPVPTLQHE